VTVRHRVRAHNIDTASTNKIHEDATALRYGFEGGLVPGVDVFGYATHAIVDHFGPKWLADGAVHVRFDKPVYDGREITVEDADEPAPDGGLAIVVRDDTHRTCARVTARRDAAGLPEPGELPHAPLPDPVPPATADSFGVARVLGSLDERFDAARADEYLDALGETSDYYRDEGVAHPAWLLRRANRILARNVRLGPWIHVESAARYSRLVRDGDRVSTRGRVVRHWEHRGHKFVTIDVAVLAGADARPALGVTHTAIYEPRPRV
jgi:hypothetical protein